MLFIEYFPFLIAAAFGAVFGSYGTLFVYRLPRGESCFGRYFGPKSRCGNCEKTILTRDLIPVINWLVTGGKCRFCGFKIPRIYLFVEITTTILFVICYVLFGFSDNFIIHAVLCAALVILFALDYKRQILPNLILNTVLIVSLIKRLQGDFILIDIIFFLAFIMIAVSVFYQIFYKKLGVLESQQQALDYCKFILISAVSFIPLIFTFYFSLLCALLFLAKFLPNLKLMRTIFLILPFLVLNFI